MTKIIKIIKAKPTIEGAGVLLNRVFGFSNPYEFDPFLLLDDFSSDNPEDYLKGFPWHPHRGIETVTYMIEGIVEHQDNLGNKGKIKSGQVQWMTAGSGIIHQEMPKESKRTTGFQLWINLPKSNKMMTPRYQEINKIPEVAENGIKIKVIAGSYKKTKGPVEDIMANPTYFDIEMPKKKEFNLESDKENTSFAYVFEGSGYFEDKLIEKGELVSFKGNLKIKTSDEIVRFIFVSGRPLKEPIAWYGPIVMNTQNELKVAFEEFHNGTFIKKK
jgi:quercetin 2,3-dioxygenase